MAGILYAGGDKKKKRHRAEQPPPIPVADIVYGQDACFRISHIEFYQWWAGNQPHVKATLSNACAVTVHYGADVVFIFHDEQGGPDVQTRAENLIENVASGLTVYVDISAQGETPVLATRAIINTLYVF